MLSNTFNDILNQLETNAKDYEEMTVSEFLGLIANMRFKCLIEVSSRNYEIRYDPQNPSQNSRAFLEYVSGNKVQSFSINYDFHFGKHKVCIRCIE